MCIGAVKYSKQFFVHISWAEVSSVINIEAIIKHKTPNDSEAFPISQIALKFQSHLKDNYYVFFDWLSNSSIPYETIEEILSRYKW